MPPNVLCASVGARRQAVVRLFSYLVLLVSAVLYGCVAPPFVRRVPSRSMSREVYPYVVGSVLSYEINMKNVVFVTTFVSYK